MARYIAKNIVASGLADQCEIQISYAIGIAQPITVLVNTFGTGKLPDEKILELVVKNFDMRPKAIIDQLKPPKTNLQENCSIRALWKRRSRLSVGKN